MWAKNNTFFVDSGNVSLLKTGKITTIFCYNGEIPMLKRHFTFFHQKRKQGMSNVYMDEHEIKEAVDALTTSEFKLYVQLYYAILKNPDTSYFSDANLAKELGLAVGTVASAKSALKAKGFARIVKFKDESGSQCLRVIIGKDQMALYNAGIKVSITDPKAFNTILDEYPLLDTTIPIEQREKMVDEINQKYSNNKSR